MRRELLYSRGRGREVAVDQRDLVSMARGAEDVEEVSGEHRVHALEEAVGGRGGAEALAWDGDGGRAGEAEAAGEHLSRGRAKPRGTGRNTGVAQTTHRSAGA